MGCLSCCGVGCVDCVFVCVLSVLNLIGFVW